ncbi:MAG: AAA family ATPase [Lachnospiraceae bacterium]
MLTHTRLVLEALEAAPEFWALDVERRAALWLAALLHDVGKAACTRLEGGAWTSPHHGQAGARLVRALLWREYGLAGEARGRGLRELVCTLIRHHAAPAHLFEAPHPERRLLRLAAQGELVPLFSLRLLKMLAEADARGRLAADRAEVLERLELGFLPAEELGILERPYAFASPRAELAYFEGRLAYPAQELYDDSWGEVLLLCGLPGTGKDTWLRANAPGLAVVSPDEVRAEYGLPPTGPQEEVMRLAAERAKALLRQRIPFAWNATSVSQSLRARQLELFSRYGARVRIVCLETGWETGLARNAARAEAVPETAIERMLERLEPPERWEAARVDWLCT